jgi:serine/threonine-protein kinase
MAANSFDTLRQGTMLSQRYKIVRKLGEGGYGAVYLAEDIRLADKKVAIKELMDATTESQALFANEAKLLASLNHHGLVRVSDFFSEGRSYYLVMDYIEGQDLLEFIADAESKGIMLPFDQVMDWMTQLCEAVAYIHKRNPPIVHRDIKPSNVRLNTSGQAVLVDFGIAKADPKAKTVRMAKAVSLGFSPPEQYGSGSGTDTRSDVYALGATLYCLLSIQIPTDASERLINSAELVAPSTFNKKVPKALDAIILKAMSMNSLQRYRDASELLDALRTLQGKKAAAPVNRPQPAAPSASPVPHPPVQPIPQPSPVCKTCGNPIRAGARFCSRCGADQTRLAPGQNRCPKCNTVTRPGAKFCPQCRTALMPIVNPAAMPANSANQVFASSYQPPAPGTPAFQQAQATLAQARQAFEQERYPQAATGYETLLQLGVHTAQIYCELGLCYIETKRPLDAVNLLEKGKQRFSNDIDLSYALAVAYYFVGSINQAISLLEANYRQDPDHEKTIDLLINLYQEQKRNAPVVPILEAQLQKHPYNNQIALRLGYAFLLNGQLKDAENLAKSLRRQLSSESETAMLLGMVYYRQNRNKQALKEFQQAQKLDPRNAMAAYFTGEIYSEQKKYRNALDAYQKAASLNPDDANIHARLFLALFALNRHQEAMAELAIAQRIDPQNPMVQEIVSRMNS